MGNKFSNTQRPHFEHQQRLFQEYQTQPPDVLLKNRERWQAVDNEIYNMPIEKQADYADYVTVGLCKMEEEIIVSFSQDLVEGFAQPNTQKVGSCLLGNRAFIILTLSKFPNQKELYEKLLKSHWEYIKRIKQIK